MQKYLIDIFKYDPAKLIGSVRRPALVLQGLRDIQVSEADARLLSAAGVGAKLVLLGCAVASVLFGIWQGPLVEMARVGASALQ